MMRLIRFLAVALFGFLLPALAAGQPGDFLPSVPTGSIEVALSPFASGLGGTINGVDQGTLTKIVPFPDGSGRNLVSTIGGTLRVTDSSGNPLDSPLGGAYLDLTTPNTQVNPFAFGTLSVAFHPEFATPNAAGFGKLYTVVTEQAFSDVTDYDFEPTFGSLNNHAEIVTEFTVSPDAINSNRLLPGDVTRRDLFSVRQPDAEHNIGDLAFDENNLLYISVGDGLFDFNGGAITQAAGNATSLSDPFGSILRIDPLGNNSANGQYGIPTGPGGNVLANDGDSNTLGEIFSYGHRNPFRISYDEPTQQLFVGEVGQFNIEEVNISQNGGNFGWPWLEGTFLVNQSNAFDLTLDADTDGDGVGQFSQTNGLIEPVFQYDHQEGVSVAGGFVYRGTQLPDLVGQYVFGDFGGGSTPSALFAGDPTTGQFERLNVVDSSLPSNVVSFGVDAAGELFVLGLDGTIFSIVAPEEAPPQQVLNSSFEDNGGSLAGWTSFFDIGPNIAVSDLPDQDGNATDGPNSLQFTGQFNGGFNFQGIFQNFAIDGGDRILASVESLVRSLDSLTGEARAELSIEYFDVAGGAVGTPNFLGEVEAVLANASSTEDEFLLNVIQDIAPANAVEARFVLTFLQFDNGDTGSVFLDAAAFLVVETGDYDADGLVDADDFELFSNTFGGSVSEAGLGADGNRDGVVSAADFVIFRDSLAAGSSLEGSVVAIPEPLGLTLSLGGCLALLGRRSFR